RSGRQAVRNWPGCKYALVSILVRSSSATLSQRPVWCYTVVGDSVNVASRLESVSRAGEGCISEATYREIEGHIAATKLAPVYVKNRLQPVHVYTVQVALDGEV